MGRVLRHPQRRGVDRAVHAERPRGGAWISFPGRYIHIGGDEANKDKWKASPRDSGADQGAGRGRRARAPELVHPPDGHVPDKPQAAARRMGRDSRWRPGRQCRRHVVARNEGRHGGRARGARRGHDADEPYLSGLLPVHKSDDRAARARRVPPARDRVRVRADSRGPRAAIRAAGCSEPRRNCGPSTCHGRSRSNTWRFRGSRRWQRSCGHRRMGRTTRPISRGSRDTWSGSASSPSTSARSTHEPRSAAVQVPGRIGGGEATRTSSPLCREILAGRSADVSRSV